MHCTWQLDPIFSSSEAMPNRISTHFATAPPMFSRNQCSFLAASLESASRASLRHWRPCPTPRDPLLRRRHGRPEWRLREGGRPGLDRVRRSAGRDRREWTIYCCFRGIRRRRRPSRFWDAVSGSRDPPAPSLETKSLAKCLRLSGGLYPASRRHAQEARDILSLSSGLSATIVSDRQWTKQGQHFDPAGALRRSLSHSRFSSIRRPQPGHPSQAFNTAIAWSTGDLHHILTRSTLRQTVSASCSKLGNSGRLARS